MSDGRAHVTVNGYSFATQHINLVGPIEECSIGHVDTDYQMIVTTMFDRYVLRFKNLNEAQTGRQKLLDAMDNFRALPAAEV